MTDFRTRLAALGLSQAELRRFVEALSGHALDRTTTSRWARGTRAVPPEMAALLSLIEDPRPLFELRSRLSSVIEQEMVIPSSFAKPGDQVTIKLTDQREI